MLQRHVQPALSPEPKCCVVCVPQGPSRMMRQSSFSTAPFTASAALPSRIDVSFGQTATNPDGASPSHRAVVSSPASLQAQLASVTLRHRSSASPSPVPSSSIAQSPVPTPSPPAPPPLPPLSPRIQPKLASLQRQLPSTVTDPVLQHHCIESSPAPRFATPSQAASPPRPSPPPPPPPPPPHSASENSAQLRSRMGDRQLPSSDTPSPLSVRTLQRKTPSQDSQSQSRSNIEGLSEDPSTSPSMGIDSRVGYGRQPSAGPNGSLAAADAGQQQPPPSGKFRLQPPLQRASQEMLQSTSSQRPGAQHAEQQQAWRQPPDRDEDTDEVGIAAVHAPQSLLKFGGVAELQSGAKKRWPTVQSNLLYQQPDADASASVTPGEFQQAIVFQLESHVALSVRSTVIVNGYSWQFAVRFELRCLCGRPNSCRWLWS